MVQEFSVWLCAGQVQTRWILEGGEEWDRKSSPRSSLLGKALTERSDFGII